jgi:hypothetical protein
MTRRRFPASTFALLLLAALLSALGATAVSAQDDPAPYVLHVYANLIQVPALVLSKARKPLPPVPLTKFDISLDSGPTFHPTQMRLEGDDPISLAILIDASDSHDSIVQNFSLALSSLSPGFLHPQDHISIYAVDCALIRSSNDLPAGAFLLRAGVDHALAALNLHGPKRHSNCADTLRLWDSVVTVARALADMPGRRVLLIVSNGTDKGSQTKWADTLRNINLVGVGVFGMRSSYAATATQDAAQFYSRHSFGVPASMQTPYEDPFQELCEANGGIILNSRSKDLSRTLATFVTLLRNRYILEFPRSNDAPSGQHNITVTISRTDAFITTAGVLVPLADPKLLADPNTVPTTPSQIKFGTRRPLDPNNPSQPLNQPH